MQLLELSPAEVAFLTSPPAAIDRLQAHLTRRLAATLTARLRLPVEVAAQPVDAPVDAPLKPLWQPDAGLATLWLTRRLGGQHVTGATPFVPDTLIYTLDAALAESWLDAAAQATPAGAMAWRITADLTRATLVVHLPHTPTEMTRWARGAIRHG